MSPKKVTKKTKKVSAKKKTATKKKPSTKKKTATKKTSKSKGVQFKDPGFRLTVINELLGKGHFKKALEEAQEAGGEVDDFEIDPVVKKAVDRFVLTPELLAEVTSIAPDGGDAIYAALIPVWDGESDEFDIASLEDVALLPKLQKVSLFSMCSKGIDLAPLASIPKLEYLHVSFAPSWVKNHKVLDAIEKRGVEVKR